MKHLLLAFSLALASMPLISHGVTLDLKKFKEKAKANLEYAIGKENIVGNARLIFRDGAGSTDLEPLFDYASFIYVVTPKAGVLANNNLRLGYRLPLNGDPEDIVLLSTPKRGQFAVANAHEGIATLLPSASELEQNNLVAELSKKFPTSRFELLDQIHVINFYSTVLELANVYKELEKSKLVQSLDLSNEAYRTEFHFDPFVYVFADGKIDADEFRVVTKRYKKQGLRFTTETTVPGDLQ